MATNHSRTKSIAGLATVAVLVVIAGAAPAQSTEEIAAPEQSTASDEGETFTNAGESGSVLPEMVVEAENRVRQKIEKSTFSFTLSAATIDSFYTAMDAYALSVSPVSGLQPHLNNLENLASDQPPHFWIQEMASTPVATFSPTDPEGHKVKSWSLAITDFRGSPFRTFAGKGSPPETVTWDGRDDRDEILEVGYPYSYVFSVTDKGTNTYNYAGMSFRIPALDYRDGGDRVLEMAGGELFQREGDELSDSGRDWLIRCTDEIRRHPYSPVRVVVTAESEKLAGRRADIVSVFLAESMILPREQVETEAVQKADLRAEMDGSVAVRIEHASDRNNKRENTSGARQFTAGGD